jgi:hypothetical protein
MAKLIPMNFTKVFRARRSFSLGLPSDKTANITEMKKEKRIK